MSEDMDRLSSREFQLWHEVVKLLKETGAVTPKDCEAGITEIPRTPGMKLFHAIRNWGEARTRLFLVEPIEAIERASGILDPNSGPWSRAEKERSWESWKQQAKEAIDKASGRL